MLAALAALRREAGFSLHVLHVEHGMRPAKESRGDARAVKIFCEKLNVPCRIVSIKPGLIFRRGAEKGIGPEAAARLFRSRALKREARRIGAERILTAHTIDDLLETILMRIIRGSGPAGLARMPAEKGKLLRPLLKLTHSDVLNYLKSRDLVFRTDSSNTDMRYLRNRIRHQLIPCLDNFFPSWRKSILSLGETQSRVAEFITMEAGKRLPWNSGADLWLDSRDFLAQPQIIQEEAVYLGTDRLHGEKNSGSSANVPRRQSLRSLLESFNRGEFKKGDLGPVSVEMKDGRIIVTGSKNRGYEFGYAMLIDSPGVFVLRGMTIKVDSLLPEAPAETSVFYASLPLVFRKWNGGDFIIRAGHKYLLSDILKGKSRDGFTGFITAEDPEGNAAFIGTGNPQADFLFSGKENPCPGKYRVSISFNGGIVNG